MPSPSSDSAKTGHRSLRASSRSPLTDSTADAPAQKKGGKKVFQPASQSQPKCQSLQETRKKGRMKLNRSSDEDIVSQLQRMDLRRSDAVVTGTALVCDERLADFHCLWDKDFPECPARLTAVKEKLDQYGLTQRCIPVQAREADDEEILLVHSPEYLERMKSTQSMSEEELRTLSDSYDSIYLHPKSYSSACLAAGSVLQLVDKVFAGEARNGMAVVRPPGHHAHWEKMDGYCMFNSIAMAARYAQHNHGASRILIVDWDVHHGQGTQYMFEDDPSVLYFSIHRYKQGHFWPHLPESHSSAVGEGRGEGFTINVPWNKIGMGDADYIAAFLHLLLPIAHEFQPHLVLVAAGFDSVIGDPKGEMAASPACFAHLTHLLMPLAGGKVILSLEGGYNLRSLAEGSCAALKILLGDPCPRLASPITPCQSALASISEAIGFHYKFWKSLRHYGTVDVIEEEAEEQEEEASPTPKELDVMLDTAMAEVMRVLPPERTGMVYDERMMEHFNAWDSHHPELPERISRIYQRHMELGLVERCCTLPPRHASDDELQMCHSLEYIQTIRSTADMKPRDLHRLGGEYNSIFINTKSYESACLAAGCSFSAIEAVMMGKVQNAVAIVRPPGHHAESDGACGFCFFNTASLTARYAQRIAGRRFKVMILDWDVHHGNGTQHIFEDDPSVLYVSLHRYDHATFFPTSTDANYDRVGHGSGAGFNVNIAWNNSKMGDAEYLMAFHRAVLPIAYEFNPDLVVLSAGFDAARGDPLGGCFVSPEGYAHMTHLLMGLAGGKIVMLLEGGYNLSSISESMTMCTRTLLGDPLPDLGKLRAPQRSAQQSVSNTVRVHKKYWKSLQLNVPEFVVPAEEMIETKPVTPSKSHSPTPKPSTPERRNGRSPGQATPPVGIDKNHNAKQAEKQSIPMLPLGRQESPIGTDSGHKVNNEGETMVPLSPIEKPDTPLRFEKDQQVEKAAEVRDPILSMEKPKTPVGSKDDHEKRQAKNPRVPLSPSRKPKICVVLENVQEVDKAGESKISGSPSGKLVTPVTFKNGDDELEEADKLNKPMSPLLKSEIPMEIEKHSEVGETGSLRISVSSLGNPESTVGTGKSHTSENEALSVSISPRGKPDMLKETLAGPGESPSAAVGVPLLILEETLTQVGAEKYTFEVCQAEMGVPQLELQESVPLVVEGADSKELLAGELKVSKLPVEAVDHTPVSASESLAIHSGMGETVTPLDKKNDQEEASLARVCLLPTDEFVAVLGVNKDPNKDPGKEWKADTVVGLPMREPTDSLSPKKDHSEELTADMKVLHLSAGEPAPLEQICNLEQFPLSNTHVDNPVISKDSSEDSSCLQIPAVSTLPVSAYQNLTSVPVGGARRKVKPCTRFSDSPTKAGSSSPSFVAPSSPASASPTSLSTALSESPSQTFSTAPTTPASASPAAPSPSSPCLTRSASCTVPSPALSPLASSGKPLSSAPSLASEGSSIPSGTLNAETMVGHEEGHSADPVVDVSLSLQLVDLKDQSKKETPEGCASSSPKKDELLEEATGWTNPLTSRPLCQLFGNYPTEESEFDDETTEQKDPRRSDRRRREPVTWKDFVKC